MEELCGIEEASERLNVPVATLRYWRHKNIGPQSARVGKRVMYRVADLEAYVDGKFAAAGPAA